MGIEGHLPDTDTRLQELVLDSRDVRDFLAELAVLAAARLSGPGNTIHSGVTVLRRKRPEVVACSDAVAAALDELQNSFGDGPCLTALRTGTTILAADLSTEQRWTPYIQAASAQGVSSILAVPLDLAGEAEAVLNLYSDRIDGFPGEDIATVEAFTGQAASSLRLVLRITQLKKTRNDLAAAMQSRTVIDMAVGAIMAENRCSSEEAFGILTRASNARNVKLREVAAAVVTSIAGQQQVSTYFDE
jgi:GAF domain-containing protein